MATSKGHRTYDTSGIEQLCKGWSTALIGDMACKVAVVTAGSHGVGYRACRKLCENNAHVLMVVPAKGCTKVLTDQFVQEAAINDELFGAQQNAVHAMQGSKHWHIDELVCDLSSLGNIVKLVRQIKQITAKIDTLIALTGSCQPAWETAACHNKEGIETTLAENYFAPALLATTLLNMLLKSPAPRFIFETSSAEKYGRLNLHNLTGAHHIMSAPQAYCTSQLYMMAFAQQLAERVEKLDVFCVDPGRLMTPTTLRNTIISFLFTDLEACKSVATTAVLYAATSPALTGQHWGWFGPNFLEMNPTAHRRPVNPVTSNPASRWKLFEATLDVFKEKLGSSVPLTVPSHPDNVYESKRQEMPVRLDTDVTEAPMSPVRTLLHKEEQYPESSERGWALACERGYEYS